MGHESLMLDDEGCIVDVTSLDIKGLTKVICDCRFNRDITLSIIKCMEDNNVLHPAKSMTSALFNPNNNPKFWSWDYLYTLISLTNNDNSSVLFRHIDEVVRHLKKKERTKAAVMDIVSPVLFTVGALAGFFMPVILISNLFNLIAADKESGGEG